MNNDLNIVRAGQLQSVASAAKNFFAQAVIAELEDLDAFTGATSVAGGASGLVPAPAAGGNKNFLRGDGTWSSVANGCTLDTVPATVDGGMWYELENSAPLVKFYYGGTSFLLNLSAAPNLTLSPASQTITSGNATVNVSYAGSGTVAVSAQGITGALTASYNSSTKVITLPYSSSEASGGGDVTVTAALSASAPYTADSASCIVVMSSGGTGGGGVVPGGDDSGGDTSTYGLEIYDDPDETSVLTGGNGSYTLTLAGMVILKITGCEGHAVMLLDADENDITTDLHFDDTEYIFTVEPGVIPPLVTININDEPAITLTVEEA